MIIMCDWDDIINNLMESTIELYNAKNNKSISVDDITDYNFYNCLDKTDADGLVSLFNSQELWESLKPTYGSQDGLKFLINSGHEVYLATATASENFAWKCQWLRKYFPFFNIDNVIRIKNKALLDCDIIIDDCLDNLKPRIREKICLDHPHNRNDTVDFAYDIRRCKNWKEILEEINKIEKETKTK